MHRAQAQSAEDTAAMFVWRELCEPLKSPVQTQTHFRQGQAVHQPICTSGLKMFFHILKWCFKTLAHPRQKMFNPGEEQFKELSGKLGQLNLQYPKLLPGRTSQALQYLILGLSKVSTLRV